MRKQTAVDLGDSRSAVVRELRVRDVRALLERVDSLQGLAALPLPTLLNDHLPELLSLAADSLTLPAATTLEDLSLSECEAIGRAWWELHARFFAPVLKAAGVLPPALMHATPAPSTAPPWSASNAATPASGTTAGDSSSS
jgi:hypothetical protein